MTADYATGAHRNEGVWHNSEFARIFYGETSILEQMELSDMLYDVKLEQIIGMDSGVLIPNKFAIVRPATTWDPQPKYLRRIVTSKYNPTQNRTLGSILEGLQKTWPLEGTAVLKSGEVIFVQLEIGQFYVGNRFSEEHKSYLLVANDHIKNGIMWLETNTRVVCSNTYAMAIAGMDGITLPHTSESETILKFLALIEEKTIVSEQERREELNALFTRKVDRSELAGIVEAAFPFPGKSSREKIADAVDASIGLNITDEGVVGNFFTLATKDQETREGRIERAKFMRAAVGAAYGEFNDTYPYAANTAYAGFQSITGVVNHGEMHRGSDEKQQISLLFGEKAQIQKRAWDASVSLLK